MKTQQETYTALKQLRQGIPQLAELLKLDGAPDIETWANIIDAKLLSRFAPDFPLVAAICGGGSSGKSSLFNSLLGAKLTPTGGKAGLNRRVLFSVPADRLEQPGFIEGLVAPFKADPAELQAPQELLTPGSPLYVAESTGPGNLVLLDTPDFDTGAAGEYTNRDITRSALEASDILIYVFTNSNYNNRDNTDFMSRMLTGIGRRKCFLIYRVYPSFTADEVCEHALTVARGIYGDEADDYLLGIYRADEDNRVASGDTFMKLHAVRERDPEFLQALEAIDAAKLRLELFASMFIDVLARTRQLLDSSRLSLSELRLYSDALQTAQSRCVHQALTHFPADLVMRTFARIWAQSDPAHIKFMRKTGTLIELPLKAIVGIAGWARDQLSGEVDAKASADDFGKKLDEDLVTAVTDLHYRAVSPGISVSGAAADPIVKRMLETVAAVNSLKGSADAPLPSAEPAGEPDMVTIAVDAHPAVYERQTQLKQRDFTSILESILSRKESLIDISRDMQSDLRELADNLRSKMGLWTKISQTFWAFLNVLPATVAVTYVLSTGDPVGAVGIKVKLIGLFGAKDLYALFAIPVTTGLKRADRKQIEELLAPIMQTWLNHKLKAVQVLFEEHITGETIREAGRVMAAAEALIAENERGLVQCRKGVHQE